MRTIPPEIIEYLPRIANYNKLDLAIYGHVLSTTNTSYLNPMLGPRQSPYCPKSEGFIANTYQDFIQNQAWREEAGLIFPFTPEVVKIYDPETLTLINEAGLVLANSRISSTCFYWPEQSDSGYLLSPRIIARENETDPVYFQGFDGHEKARAKCSLEYAPPLTVLTRPLDPWLSKDLFQEVFAFSQAVLRDEVDTLTGPKPWSYMDRG